MKKYFATLIIFLLLSFVLLDKGGLISVYEEPDLSSPVIETNISVRLLPDADQKSLKTGICVESKEALHNILEDLR